MQEQNDWLYDTFLCVGSCFLFMKLPTSKKAHSCAQCTKTFSTKSNLTKHVSEIHLGIKPYACDQCDKSFSRSLHLRTHTASIHQKATPHKCSECDRSFSQKSNLTSHMRAVHGTSNSKTKPFRCDVCRKDFSQKHHMEKHKRTVHDGEKAYKCPECDRAFSQRSHVKVHVASVHRLEQPHACPEPECDRRFSTNANLKKHVAVVHRGERPHACPRCSEGFSSKAHLRTHASYCGGKKLPHCCNACDERFSTKFDLQVHVLASHNRGSPREGDVETVKCVGSVPVAAPAASCDAAEYERSRSDPRATGREDSYAATRREESSAGIHDDDELGSNAESIASDLDDSEQSSDKSPFVLEDHASTFPFLQPIQDNVLLHNTSSEACESILSSRCFEGRVPHNPRYDGFSSHIEDSASSPASAYFAVQPATDKMIFPFSQYPKRLADGTHTKLLQVDARILGSTEFELYYVGTTPSQFGQGFKRVFQTHVTVATRGSPGANFAESRFKPLDKHTNHIFRVDASTGVASTSMKVLVNGVVAPHSVVVSFLNGLKFRETQTPKVRSSYKISFRHGRVRCPEPGCSTSFDSVVGLKSHFLAVHTQLKPFACELCDKAFARKAGLSKHVLAVHTKERTHECPECRKSFFDRDKLRVHISTVHLGEKQFQCPKCDKCFSVQSNLNRHVSTVHNKQKAHACLECEKTFSQKGNLKKHVLAVHRRERPHKCAHCDSAFAQKRDLTRHTSIVHRSKEGTCTGVD